MQLPLPYCDVFAQAAKDDDLLTALDLGIRIFQAADFLGVDRLRQKVVDGLTAMAYDRAWNAQRRQIQPSPTERKNIMRNSAVHQANRRNRMARMIQLAAAAYRVAPVPCNKPGSNILKPFLVYFLLAELYNRGKTRSIFLDQLNDQAPEVYSIVDQRARYLRGKLCGAGHTGVDSTSGGQLLLLPGRSLQSTLPGIIYAERTGVQCLGYQGRLLRVLHS